MDMHTCHKKAIKVTYTSKSTYNHSEEIPEPEQALVHSSSER